MSERMWLGPREILESAYRTAKFPEAIVIRDCTLREGEQAADITFSIEDKLEIAHRLEDMGIKYIQAGSPGRSEIDKSVFEKLRNSKASIEALIVAYAPGWEQEIDAAVSAGAKMVDIVFPSSDYRLKGAMNLTQNEMLGISRKAIAYAKQKGLHVAFGPTDGTRTSLEFLRRIGEMAVKEGADCLNISDTVGIATPEVITLIVRSLRDLGIKLAIHAHNDLGLALANSLAAVREGATIVDACVNGLGDRTGNVALDEIIIALQEVLGQPLGIKTEKLYELSKFVEEVTRFPIPPTKPLVGRQAFTYKFDTHLEAVLKSTSAFQAINPQIVGRKIEMALGTTSGPFAIRAKAKEMGIKLDDRRVDEIVALVRHKALELRRALTDAEFRDIVTQSRK